MWVKYSDHPSCYDPSPCSECTCLVSETEFNHYLTGFVNILYDINQPVDHDVPDFQKLVISHNHIPLIRISSHYFYCHSSVRSDLTCQEVSHPHFLPLLLWHQHCADSPKNISLRSTGQRTVQNSWGEINISIIYLCWMVQYLGDCYC